MQKLVVLLATLAFSGSAYAADMALKASPNPVPAAAASWTGFYIGAEVGGGQCAVCLMSAFGGKRTYKI
jgi:outer membrane immunogenic protein